MSTRCGRSYTITHRHTHIVYPKTHSNASMALRQCSRPCRDCADTHIPAFSRNCHQQIDSCADIVILLHWMKGNVALSSYARLCCVCVMRE